MGSSDLELSSQRWNYFHKIIPHPRLCGGSCKAIVQGKSSKTGNTRIFLNHCNKKHDVESMIMREEFAQPVDISLAIELLLCSCATTGPWTQSTKKHALVWTGLRRRKGWKPPLRIPWGEILVFFASESIFNLLSPVINTVLGNTIPCCFPAMIFPAHHTTLRRNCRHNVRGQ